MTKDSQYIVSAEDADRLPLYSTVMEIGKYFPWCLTKDRSHLGYAWRYGPGGSRVRLDPDREYRVLWEGPPEAPSVGDFITEQQMKSLPVKSAVVDTAGDVWVNRFKCNEWYLGVVDKSYSSQVVIEMCERSEIRLIWIGGNGN